MYRFFVNEENILDDGQILITGDDVRHITRSLRLEPGNEVMVSDGQGTDYLVELIEFSLDQVTCKVLEKVRSKGEPAIEVTLFQGLPKGDKLDLITQKCTEIGIRQILPVETSRTIVKLNDKKAERRLERWQKIAEEAAKQSDRGQIPTIGPILSWKEALKQIKGAGYDLVLVPWERAKDQSVRQVVLREKADREIRQIAYVVGPEGGLSQEEVQALLEAGAQPVTLGPRILRTETAGFVLLTVLMYEFLQMEGC